MTGPNNTPSYGAVAYFATIFVLATYFVFASVQGDFGLFRRVQIEAEATVLRLERDQLHQDVASLRNKTRRLSDGFLDLDLLDEQARDVLGFARADEIIIR